MQCDEEEEAQNIAIMEYRCRSDKSFKEKGIIRYRNPDSDNSLHAEILALETPRT